LRNGIVYGVKIRFPHALVMTFLFRSGSLRDKLALIVKLTRQHAVNLGCYAALYKLILYLESKLHKETSSDSLIAGLIGGYLIFGDGSPVSQQINLYVFGRVAMALAKLVMKKNPTLQKSTLVSNYAAPVFASLCWGSVMWLFRWHPDIVQPSMRSSMRYLYLKSNTWDDWRSYLLEAGNGSV